MITYVIRTINNDLEKAEPLFVAPDYFDEDKYGLDLTSILTNSKHFNSVDEAHSYLESFITDKGKSWRCFQVMTIINGEREKYRQRVARVSTFSKQVNK